MLKSRFHVFCLLVCFYLNGKVAGGMWDGYTDSAQGTAEIRVAAVVVVAAAAAAVAAAPKTVVAETRWTPRL